MRSAVRWEYKWSDDFWELAELGERGWELVCIDSGRLYFKRKLRELPDELPAKHLVDR